MKHRLLTALGTLFFTATLQAQTPELLYDVDPTYSSDPNYMTVTGNNMYWVADDGTHGKELWMKPLNDTPRLVKDINAGSGHAGIDHLAGMAGKVYFSANDGSGDKMWMSDGTDAGTLMLKDIEMTVFTDFARYQVIEFNGKLYFAGDDGTTGKELWVTDGTTAGTTLVKDIYSGAGPGDPYGFVVYNGKFYFSANDPSQGGVQLWVSDGTTAGTHLVKNLNPQGGDSYPSQKVVFNNKIYFGARDNAHYSELWSSDGTDAGTAMVVDFNPGTGPGGGYNPVVAGGKLFYIGNDGVHGAELCTSDGTAAGTHLVKDIYPGPDDCFAQSFTELNGKLYFGARGANPSELWVSDGTDAGTYVVKVISTGQPSVPVKEMKAYHGRLFFQVEDSANGWNMWTSDGYGVNTHIVNVNPPLYSTMEDSPIPCMAILGDSLYYSAVYGGPGQELYKIWASDITGITAINKNELKASLYPNPASADVQLSFTLDKAANTHVLLTDVTGKTLKTWDLEKLNAGTNNVGLRLPSALNAGIYFLHLSSGNAASTIRFIVQ